MTSFMKQCAGLLKNGSQVVDGRDDAGRYRYRWEHRCSKRAKDGIYCAHHLWLEHLGVVIQWPSEAK